jgi:hypothetical protein
MITAILFSAAVAYIIFGIVAVIAIVAPRKERE